MDQALPSSGFCVVSAKISTLDCATASWSLTISTRKGLRVGVRDESLLGGWHELSSSLLSLKWLNSKKVDATWQRAQLSHAQKNQSYVLVPHLSCKTFNLPMLGIMISQWLHHGDRIFTFSLPKRNQSVENHCPPCASLGWYSPRSLSVKIYCLSEVRKSLGLLPEQHSS